MSFLPPEILPRQPNVSGMKENRTIGTTDKIREAVKLAT
jgi:hypothetical protein